MGKVKIVTNAVCDLSPKKAAHLGIYMIPETVIFEDEQFRTGIDLAPAELYEKLRAAKELPTGAHPNVAGYLDAFREAGKDADEVLCVNMTSRMSGSFSTACIARDMLEEEGFHAKIYTYDSLQLCSGLAILVLEAVRLSEEGCSASEIIEGLDKIRGKIGVYFIMRSLQNAKKGGRVGAIRVLAADTLGVKPVLMFRDGIVSDVGIARNYKLGLQKIISYYEQRAERGKEAFIFQANNLPDAEFVKAELLRIDPEATVHIEWIGPGIGIYTGEGAVGIAFHEKA